MENSSKLSAFLLILMLSFSSSFHIASACGFCPTPSTPAPAPKEGPITLPPIIGKPPITLPPVIGKPPITLPPIIGKPPITLPPIIVKPPITIPPIVVIPPITLPPIIGNPPITEPPVTGKPGCSPAPTPAPAVKETCPVDTLKFGTCLDILGSVIQIGDPAVSECCPLIEGLSGIEAAACLCTTIKLKFLNINALFPVAISLLVSCGKTPPPGYTCA